MKLTETVWEKCDCCNQRTKIIQEESYGCDYCKKPMDDLLNGDGKNHADFLSLTIHRHGGEAESLELCSWCCVFEKLKTVRTNYFISLPYLTFESDTLPGQRVKDFFAAMKAV